MADPTEIPSTTAAALTEVNTTVNAEGTQNVNDAIITGVDEMDEEMRRAIEASREDTTGGDPAVPLAPDFGPVYPDGIRDVVQANRDVNMANTDDDELQRVIELSRLDAGVPIGPVYGPAGEDEDLQRVLLESTRTAAGAAGTAAGAVGEDEELQRALMLSMQHDGGRSPGLGQSQSDIEIQKAIEASIFANQGSTAARNFGDPVRLKRDHDVPSGLRNVGNTCYVNSLLQTYFMIPSFRHYIFSTGYFEITDDDLDSLKQSKKFFNELQLLFASMMYSNKKFSDPSNLLQSIVDERGNSMEIGKQEDVGEFMDMFHDWMEKCVSRIQQDKAETNAIQEMFLIEGVSIMEAEEADGEIITSTTDEKYSFLMLDVQEQNFHNSLESRLSTEMEWKTPKGHNTLARQETWLKKLPPILMFREQRIEYVLNVGALKNNSALHFDKDIDMERYLFRNKQDAEGKRIVSAELRHELASVQLRLDEINNYKNLGTSLETILEGSLKFLEECGNESALEQFKSLKDEKMEEIERLKQEAENLKERIKNEYSDLVGSPYTLCGLWLHSGSSAGSGHYWAYIRDPLNDLWYKFNDMEVNQVEDEGRVWEDAVGGPDSGVSAYFLIYISTDVLSDYHGLNFEEIIAPEIMEMVEQQNRTFEREIEDYENSHLSPLNDFIVKFNKRVIETEHRSMKSKYARDYRYHDPATYLHSFGRHYESHAVIYIDLWDELLSKKSNVPEHQQIKMEILNSKNNSLTKEELDTIFEKVKTFHHQPEIKKRILDEFNNYSLMMSHFYRGIVEANKHNFPLSVQYLHQAYSIKQEIREGTARLDIETLLLVLCKDFYDNTLANKDPDLTVSLNKVTPILMALYNEEERENTRNDFINWYFSAEDAQQNIYFQDLLSYLLEEDREYSMPGKNHFGHVDSSIPNQDHYEVAKSFFHSYSLLLSGMKEKVLCHQTHAIFEGIYNEIESITNPETEFAPFIVLDPTTMEKKLDYIEKV